jgi:excinuclease UvrABC ATPase subunit
MVIVDNVDAVRNADWVIDPGPEGGSKGGKIMFEGTPAELKKDKQSITSKYI